MGKGAVVISASGEAMVASSAAVCEGKRARAVVGRVFRSCVSRSQVRIQSSARSVVTGATVSGRDHALANRDTLGAATSGCSNHLVYSDLCPFIHLSCDSS
jgi:hypothetical protein